MSETRAEYATVTTTQPIGTVQHTRPKAMPTLRQYLQEREMHLLRDLQRIRDLLAQLPRE